LEAGKKCRAVKEPVIGGPWTMMRDEG